MISSKTTDVLTLLVIRFMESKYNGSYTISTCNCLNRARKINLNILYILYILYTVYYNIQSITVNCSCLYRYEYYKNMLGLYWHETLCKIMRGQRPLLSQVVVIMSNNKLLGQFTLKLCMKLDRHYKQSNNWIFFFLNYNTNFRDISF